MKLQRLVSTIVLASIFAISVLALLCTMPMASAHSHCSDTAMTMVSDGTMPTADCVGSHYSTYLQASLAIFEKQVLGFVALLISTFVLAFWLLRLNRAAQLQALGTKLYERYKRFWYFILPLHRIKELQWQTIIERKLVAVVA